jgi:AcrR family transcriptional regulator
MEQIAAGVGLSPSSLYNHWSSKHSILVDIIQSTIEDLHDDFDKAVAGASNPREALKAATMARVKYFVLHVRETMVSNRERGHLKPTAAEGVAERLRQYVDKNRRLIESGIRTGEFDEKIDSLLATYAMLEVGSFGSNEWYGRTDWPRWVSDDTGEMVLRDPGRLASVSLEELVERYCSMALKMVLAP